MAEAEPERGDLEGAARSRRFFLRNVIGIAEERLRQAEDAQHVPQTEANVRSLRRLRWEL